jgi:hypothetical protein
MTEVADQPEAHEGTCSKEGCPANEGGDCAEGHADKIDCQFYELTQVGEPTPVELPVRRVSLPDGEALRADELERVLRSFPVSMVVPIGRVKAGKTTLISVCYHLLRSNRIPGWKFTGSETIVGFARRAHHASFASEGTAPITPRTEKEESGLHLHLGMRRAADDERCPIVVVDLSGEHINDVANGDSVLVVERALARADHIPVVIDGRQIADVTTRPLAVFEARTLLKMLEKHDRPDGAKICVVITKGDLLVGTDLAEIVEGIVRGTLAEGSPYFVTADRPSRQKGEDDEPLVSLGHGIDGFIEHIAKRPGTLLPGDTEVVSPEPSPLLRRMWARS